ncbi:hypothetical protein RND71_033462 [Anisodus tanguticus]|uniref:Pentatricopeptide repeat-containing protein n=1 Tax=Anisodus tanguticus TaxID=243964 RepID=A0AAE1UW65_9SOLA|nr:hypothetical protein RND71_033462 [Anisodus tanguticus]
MEQRDVVSWTTLVTAYSQGSQWEAAIAVFSQMREEGFVFNQYTLAGTLVACASLCYLEYGRQLHGLLYKTGLQNESCTESALVDMYAKYNLVTETHHYACVVDLVGRVGLLSEAFEFIRKMPVELDEMVWQSLLSACRIHGDSELGEIAAKKILSVRPQYSATYVLLSNTYMESGNFREGTDLRSMMKTLGVRKEPGCSWITINDKAHKFYAGDQEHQQRDDIYLILEELRV